MHKSFTKINIQAPLAQIFIIYYIVIIASNTPSSSSIVNRLQLPLDADLASAELIEDLRVLVSIGLDELAVGHGLILLYVSEEVGLGVVPMVAHVHAVVALDHRGESEMRQAAARR